MKKLMLAVAIVCAAAMAQAAQSSWKLGAAKVNGSSLTGDNFNGIMYVFCAEQLAASDLQTALNGKTTIAAVTSYLDSNKLATGTVSGGSVSSTAAANKFKADLTPGGSFNFYYVLVDGDKYLVSANKGPIAAQDNSEVLIGFGNQQAYTQTSTNWKSVAVPEPTSGLLMLLGFAGLALRRRRA